MWIELSREAVFVQRDVEFWGSGVNELTMADRFCPMLSRNAALATSLHRAESLRDRYLLGWGTSPPSPLRLFALGRKRVLASAQPFAGNPPFSFSLHAGLTIRRHQKKNALLFLSKRSTFMVQILGSTSAFTSRRRGDDLPPETRPATANRRVTVRTD